MSKVKEVTTLYMHGGCDFSDVIDVIEMVNDTPFNKTARFRRTCLYPLFRDRVKLIDPFYLEYVYIHGLLKGKTSVIESTRKMLDKRATQERILKRRQAMDKKFINLFKEV